VTGPIPDVGDILTWPQAVFGVAVLIAVVVAPQIIGLIQNHGIKKGTDVAAHQLQNNSGASVKDAVDRIETKLTDHIALADQRDADRDARLAELEAAKGKHSV
jgi:hypothetical protein